MLSATHAATIGGHFPQQNPRLVQQNPGALKAIPLSPEKSKPLQDALSNALHEATTFFLQGEDPEHLLALLLENAKIQKKAEENSPIPAKPILGESEPVKAKNPHLGSNASTNEVDPHSTPLGKAPARKPSPLSTHKVNTSARGLFRILSSAFGKSKAPCEIEMK